MISEPAAPPSSSPGSRGEGIVLASYGRGALVQSATAILHCGLTGRRLRLVCGDHVHWEHGAAAHGPSVTAIDARRNVIERIDARGRPEPVAANVDRVGIVIAPEPAPDWFLVDRYWAGARHFDIEVMLIANKQDLAPGGSAAELAVFQRLGLICCQASCRGDPGIEVLRQQTCTGVTLLVGQSGVGKSSLVNALAPEAAAQTAQLTRDAEGRHTTTTARWYDLRGGAALIDAPGVRDFAPPAHLMRAAERGFIEIHARSVECRFNDCRHFEEPGCSVRAAVAQGLIAARRYESYRRLARLYEDLAG
jgi:ribosome biogenesis GTPase